MLSREKAYPTVAVKDMAAAREFYEGTLGLYRRARLRGKIAIDGN
jgi:hypothetical protein